MSWTKSCGATPVERSSRRKSRIAASDVAKVSMSPPWSCFPTISR
jgi:hypothetical protein